MRISASPLSDEREGEAGELLPTPGVLLDSGVGTGVAAEVTDAEHAPVTPLLAGDDGPESFERRRIHAQQAGHVGRARGAVLRILDDGALGRFEQQASAAASSPHTP